MTYVLLALASLIAVGIVWRVLSNRQSLPCPPWLGRLVEIDNPFARSNRAGFIVDSLSLIPGMQVLDAGCGPGRVTIPLAGAVGPDGVVCAADLQQGMLDRVAEKARAAGLTNVTTIRASLGAGHLEPDSFDRAVICAVLGEIPDRAAALAELFRCLKPGGLLAIAELIFDPHFQSRSSVRALANGAGFVERAAYGNRLAYLLIMERAQ
ncbi:MAG: methyltransferase domain-containing protein [Pseudomonadota bacterium]